MWVVSIFVLCSVYSTFRKAFDGRSMKRRLKLPKATQSQDLQMKMTNGCLPLLW